MSFLFDNWYVAIAIICCVWMCWFFVNLFLKMPKDHQLNKIREWLIYACVEAETIFQSNTGSLKLRFVYDKFVHTFPWMAKLVTFELFSMMVDEALVKVRLMLETNKDVKRIVDEGNKQK